MKRVILTFLLAISVGACGAAAGAEKCVDLRLQLQAEKDTYEDGLILDGVPADAARIMADAHYEVDERTAECLDNA